MLAPSGGSKLAKLKIAFETPLIPSVVLGLALRGFQIDNNRQQLRVTALNRDASEIQLRGTMPGWTGSSVLAGASSCWDVGSGGDSTGASAPSSRLRTVSAMSSGASSSRTCAPTSTQRTQPMAMGD